MFNQKIDDQSSTGILKGLIEDLSKDSKLLDQLEPLKDFDPKTVSLVSNNNLWEAYKDCQRVGDVYLTAYDGVEEAKERGMFIINCAKEFRDQLGADLEFAIEPYHSDIIQQLDSVIVNIHARVKDGIDVCLNCRMGMERSALAVAKYLEEIHGLTLDQAYEYLQSQRPIVLNRSSWLDSSNGGLY